MDNKIQINIIMDYEDTLKSIQEELTKCTVTLKAIKSQIKETLEQITDNQEEYETLVSAISYFYRENYNSKIEKLQMLSRDNTLLENSGDENGVEYPSGMDSLPAMVGDNLIYSMHNHPNDSSPFPSIQDMDAMWETEPRFMVIINERGITITKHMTNDIGDDSEKAHIYHEDLMDAYKIYDNSSDHKFRMNKDFREIQREYDRGDISVDDFNKQTNEIYQKYMFDNMETEIRNLNVEYMSKKVPVKTFYIPITEKR